MSEVKAKILQLAKKKGEITTSELGKSFSYSRVYLSRLLNEMVREGKLSVIGKTKGAKYVVESEKEKIQEIPFALRKNLVGLDENDVWEMICKKMEVTSGWAENVRSMFHYAFTEMLNNALDHSRAKTITTRWTIERRKGLITFLVIDNGVGIFNNIRKKFALKTNYEALEELLKGKKTTMKEKHSGEGIFFTSKMADIFTIQSSELELCVDNRKNEPEIRVANTKAKKGTVVSFSLSISSKRKLNDVFTAYTKDFAFTKTQIMVHLYENGTEYVSRSQAKRLLRDLSDFTVITLDFSKVKTVGQGFADEVFRVYKNSRPEVQLIPINAIEPVEFMIRRAIHAREEGMGRS